MPSSVHGPALPLALTMGEPAGIGTEVTFKAYKHYHDHHLNGDAGFFVIDDPARLARLSRKWSTDISIVTISDAAEASDAFVKGLPVLPVDSAAAGALEKVIPGRPVKETADAVISSIVKATTLAIEDGVAGVVTNPINKQVLISSGFGFKGHTDFLGDLTRDIPISPALLRGPVMLLASDELRVSPVTVHLPLKEVPQTLTTTMIVETSMVVAQSLIRDFGVAAPVLAICGLNPHAGEGGEMGVEDRDIIEPAIAVLKENGIRAVGPVPADTMFHPEARAQYHAAIGMYHDQVLIPIKTISFHSAVNVTLGLPIVRTSPDHGTGFDIAGKGVARPDSMIQAIALAREMYQRRQSFDRLQKG